jgi:RimJ/RimL family protein N-acetyltransferase
MSPATLALTSPVCTVRTFRLEDASSLARHGNDRRIWLNLRDRFPHPYHEADARAYLAHLATQPSATSFAIDVDGEAVGGISLHPGTDVERIGAEIGYWLGAEHWGGGIATAAVRLLTAHALGALSFERIFALPFTRNVASVRVLEKAGYVREGTLRRSAIKDGIVLDQHLYAMVREASGAGSVRG